MAYDDELHLEKPASVRDDTWKAGLGDYAAALALYERVKTRVDDQILAGGMATDDQRLAEDNARVLLTIARTNLLDLSRLPRRRH